MASSQELAAEHRSTAARLRQTVDAEHHIKGTAAELANQFGYSQLTPEVREYIKATLASVGLRVKPSLTECETGVEIRISRSGLGSSWPAAVGIVFLVAGLVILVFLVYALGSVVSECGFGGTCA